MDRLRVELPTELTITTYSSDNIPSTVPTSGVLFWLQARCSPVMLESNLFVCVIRFSTIRDMVKFKVHFSLSPTKNDGGLSLRLTYVPGPQLARNMIYSDKMNIGQPDNLHYELRYWQGWFKLYLPYLCAGNSISHKPLLNLCMVGFHRRVRRYCLEDLLDIAHELRQLYVEAPIKLRTSDYQYIDVTDRDAISIALMR